MIRSTPAIGKSMIFVGSDDGAIYGVDSRNRRARLALSHRRSDHGKPEHCRR